MSRKQNIKKMVRGKLKLELIVAGLIFLALLIYRELPITGSAAPDGWQNPQVEGQIPIQDQMIAEEPEPPGQSETDQASIDMAVAEWRQAGTANRITKPFGLVDARNCNGLDYERIMCGKIGTKSVWNGRRFIPQKVCIVQEDNGSYSIWSFDQNRDAVLLEIQQ